MLSRGRAPRAGLSALPVGRPVGRFPSCRPLALPSTVQPRLLQPLRGGPAACMSAWLRRCHSGPSGKGASCPAPANSPGTPLLACCAVLSPTVVRCGRGRRRGRPARACGARTAEGVDAFPAECGRAPMPNISRRDYRNGDRCGSGFLRSRKRLDHVPGVAASTVLPSFSVAVVVPKTSSVLAVVHGGALSYFRCLFPDGQSTQRYGAHTVWAPGTAPKEI